MYYQFDMHGAWDCLYKVLLRQCKGRLSIQMFDPRLNAPPLKIHRSNHGQTNWEGWLHHALTSDASSVIRVRS